MKASILSFRAAVLMVIAGTIWGIVMGTSQIIPPCQRMRT
jgi:hypothetical protein